MHFAGIGSSIIRHIVLAQFVDMFAPHRHFYLFRELFTRFDCNRCVHSVCFYSNKRQSQSRWRHSTGRGEMNFRSNKLIRDFSPCICIDGKKLSSLSKLCKSSRKRRVNTSLTQFPTRLHLSLRYRLLMLVEYSH
jgi:hypothetical protein